MSSVLNLIGYIAFRLISGSWLGSEDLIITVDSARIVGGQTWIRAI